MTKSVKIFLLVALGITLLIVAAFVYVPREEFYFFSSQATLRDSQGQLITITDQVGAEQLCQRQLVMDAGRRLVSSSFDDHSSRFDEPRGMFLVYMKAQIGSRESAQTYNVYCRIAPGATRLNFFRIKDMEE